MGNTLPCCTDNDNAAQASRLNKKNTSPQVHKGKATIKPPALTVEKKNVPCNLLSEDIFFDKLKKFGQTHLIDHYETIQDPVKKAAFLAQIKSIDYQQAAQLYQHVYLDKSAIKDQQKS